MQTEEKYWTLVDCNNFYSPSGGGVRRYHLEKMEFFKNNPQVRYVFAMPAARRSTEKLGDNAFIEHIPGVKIPGNWGYRFSISPGYLNEVLQKYTPQAVEVGSPYIMPWLIRYIRSNMADSPRIFGFWHADYPVTYVRRGTASLGKYFSELAENAAWKYACASYNWMDGVLVSSRQVMERMNRRGITKTHWVPLGVDHQFFHPGKRNPELVERMKGGESERLSIFFPHRFCEEKGVRTLLDAYPELCERLPHKPSVYFAGTGPDLDRVKEAAERYEHIHYLGFIHSREEMAEWFASADIGLALSGWETFGLSIMESLASGQVLVGADSGAAQEHISAGECGLLTRPGDSAMLVEKLIQLSRMPLKKISENSRKYASNFSWETCFSRELEIYQGEKEW
jgi:alpha-1,6-mannosyltransferase